MIIHTKIQNPDSGKLTHSDGVFMKGDGRKERNKEKGDSNLVYEDGGEGFN